MALRTTEAQAEQVAELARTACCNFDCGCCMSELFAPSRKESECSL